MISKISTGKSFKYELGIRFILSYFIFLYIDHNKCCFTLVLLFYYFCIFFYNVDKVEFECE